ncbi:hypothetical protein NDU88_004085 [Pleurodeles waltl]|uniref:Uncharacterized protein n=1 Tax=Pleurodeles waltl TaxID=8319 RepID=A0AAV7M875_PLEWA|nr:hypothetical protein NDU88_004085 [Pleurodeles waltl]
MARLLTAAFVLSVITMIYAASLVNSPRKYPKSVPKVEQSRNKQLDAGVVDSPQSLQKSGDQEVNINQQSLAFSYIFCCVLRLCEAPGCGK